jgi:hypothetical protein
MEYIMIVVAVLLYLYSLIMIIRVKRKYYISPDISFKGLLKTTTDESLRRELRLINIIYWLSSLFVLLFFVVFIFCG